MRIHRAVLVAAVIASSILTLAGPAQARRIVGSKGPDRIVGSKGGDVIRGGRGNDVIRGGRGRDRLIGGGGRDRIFGGRGADRLNALDGRRDRVIRGGPGRDVCSVDRADRKNTRGCEVVKIGHRGRRGGGGPGGGTPPGGGAPGGGTPPGATPPGGTACAAPPEEARAHSAGDAPVTFSPAFFGTTVTLGVSADEIVGDQLPISIEDVCDVPTALLTDAAQLIGGDGVAIIGPATQVFDATGAQLTGDAATAALLDADTLSLKAALLPQAQWATDEDGAAVPTFSASRADITD
jgi:RTX calcium-binding nonapeptide repeat (4 copies)